MIRKGVYDIEIDWEFAPRAFSVGVGDVCLARFLIFEVGIRSARVQRGSGRCVFSSFLDFRGGNSLRARSAWERAMCV
jgi:hypothetical protein